MNYAEESLRLHGEWQGKIEVVSRVPVRNRDELSLAYTPGVAQPCLAIQEDYNKSFSLTRRHNLVAVITDGTAVLGHARLSAFLKSIGLSVTIFQSYPASSQYLLSISCFSRVRLFLRSS